jgi:NADH-quinone oxidoreductase subunit M
MQDWPLLSLTTFLPLVGAGFILIIRGDAEVVARNARYVALWTSLTTFVLSLFIWFGFERGTADFQFLEEVGP